MPIIIETFNSLRAKERNRPPVELLDSIIEPVFDCDGDFDCEKVGLLVVGLSPVGEKGAAQVAYFGKNVALIEREEVLEGTSACRNFDF